MKKIILLLFLLIPHIVFADNNYFGTKMVSTNVNENNMEYESKMGGKNVLVISSGTSNFNNCTFNKSGDSTYSEANVYGTNAAIIVYDGTLNLDNGKISSDGKNASGIFAYESGNIKINNVTIDTLNDNSSGIVSSQGGNIEANNLTVKTNGIDSSAINSSGDNSKIVVNGGSYETNGKNSPIVYSSGSIIINDASLSSLTSSGVNIFGNGNVTFKNVKLDDTNNMYGDNANSYRNIFIYQTSDIKNEVYFSSNDSSIITNNGDTFYITNSKANINLFNNVISNNNGNFMTIRADALGTTGENGGNVILSMNNQVIEGNFIVDSVSSLKIDLKNNSNIEGSINEHNESKDISVSISDDSSWTLTEDSYISSLNNVKEDNSNIYSNGKYRLFVSDKEVDINNSDEIKKESNKSSKENDGGNGFSLIIIFLIITLVVGIGGYSLYIKAKANNSL